MSSSNQSLNYGSVQHQLNGVMLVYSRRLFLFVGICLDRSCPKKVPHTFSQYPAIGSPSYTQGLEAVRCALFEREPVKDGNRHVALPHGTSDAAASERAHRERMEKKFVEIEKRLA